MKKYLKPGPNGAPMDPLTMKELPEEGAWVEMTTYWRRRVIDKDAVVSKPPGPALRKRSDITAKGEEPSA